MSEYKLFVKRIGLIGISNLFVALSSLILLPILTKSFSVTDYGIWVQISTTLTLIPNIVTLGLPFTMVRFLSSEKDTKKIQEGFYTITIIVTITSFIVALLLFIFSKEIAFELFDNNVPVVKLLSITVFLACLNTLLLNYFRTFQQMKKYSLFLLIQTYSMVFTSSYLAIAGFGIFIASIGFFIANIVTFVIMSLLIISEIGLKIPKLENLKEYLSFGLPTIPGNLSYWIVDSSDRYIIGIILGTAFVGYYAPGYMLGNIIIMISTPFSILLPSLLPKYYDNKKIEKVTLFLKISLKYFLLIAIPSVFGLSILAKPILMIITTPEIALNGYFITPFVAVSALLFGIYCIISEIIILEKKTHITGLIWILAAIFNLCLNIVLIPYFGIIGAAATTLTAYIIAFSLTIFYSFKYLKLDFDSNFLLKSLFASTMMSIFLILFYPKTIIDLVLVLLISIMIYFIIILLLKGIKKSEIKFIKELLSN